MKNDGLPQRLADTKQLLKEGSGAGSGMKQRKFLDRKIWKNETKKAVLKNSVGYEKSY
jgi:hypothetical protein